MDVLLLCGYRPNEPIGLEQDSDGFIFLDYQIHRLQNIGLSPIVVVSGAYAEPLIRQSKFLESCELVFDTNDKEANLFTNVRAGLKTCEQACFVFPAEVPVPPEIIWKQLKIDLLRKGFSTDIHAFQVATPKGAPWHYGFPVLLSNFGRKSFLNIKNLGGLTDRRLRYHFSRPALAPVAASL